MNNKVLEKLKKENLTIALVGATNDKSKYGNIIYRDLRNKNIKVYGINPKATTIEGDTAYKDLESLPEKPDIINIVIPPKLALDFLKSAVSKNYDFFWLQPGAESPEIISFLEDNSKNFLANSCVMVESR
jgi:uncharacterized protein